MTFKGKKRKEKKSLHLRNQVHCHPLWHQHGIMVSLVDSLHKMMKNNYLTVVLKYQSSNMLQRKDLFNLMPKVAKQYGNCEAMVTWPTWERPSRLSQICEHNCLYSMWLHQSSYSWKQKYSTPLTSSINCYSKQVVQHCVLCLQ